MTRTGKIARLPRAVRDELNRRLRDGETGVGLVAWLNLQPEVRQVLVAEFEGRAINEQNLSEWKTGGYAEWQSRQEMLEDAREMAADAGELTEATAGRLSDHLATVLAARFARVLTKWNGEVNEEIRGQLKLLHGMCGDVAELRRGDHGAARLEQEQERLRQERDKTEEDMFAEFDRWTKMPPVRDLLCKDWVDPDERGRRMRSSFGLPPLEIQKQKLGEQKAEMKAGTAGSQQLAADSEKAEIGNQKSAEVGSRPSTVGSQESQKSAEATNVKGGEIGAGARNQGGSSQIKPVGDDWRLEARLAREKEEMKGRQSSQPGGGS